MADSTNSAAGSSDIRVLAKGTGIALPGQILGRILMLACHVILARVLGPQVYGLYAIGWTILRIAGLVASFGMPTGAVRIGAEEWKRNTARFRGVLIQALGAALAGGAILGLALFFAAPWLSNRVFHNPDLAQVIRLFSPCIALSAGLQVGGAATRITQRIQFSVLAQDIIQPGLDLVLTICALMLGAALRGVIVATLVSYAVALVAVLAFLRRLFPEITDVRAGFESVFKRLLGLSTVISLASIFGTVTMWVDRLIIGAMRPTADVGVYQAMSQASTVFSVILGAVSLIFTPIVASLQVDGDRHRMLELFRVSTKWILYATLPILLVVWFAARDVVSLLYGAEYMIGARTLVLLTIGQILNAATGPTGPFLNMTGSQVALMRLSGLALLSNCILGVLLVPVFGSEGAALATSLSLGGFSLASLVAVRRSLKAWPYDRRLGKVLVASLATVAFLLLVKVGLPSGGLVRLIGMAAGSLLVFGVVSIGLGLDEEDRAFLSTVRRIVVARMGR